MNINTGRAQSRATTRTSHSSRSRAAGSPACAAAKRCLSTCSSDRLAYMRGRSGRGVHLARSHDGKLLVALDWDGGEPKFRELEPARPVAAAGRGPETRGKGFSNAAFTMQNSPVAAAIPVASDRTAVAAKPGLRRKMRSAYRRSTARVSSKQIPQRRARENTTTPE